MIREDALIFEKSVNGRRCAVIPESELKADIPEKFRRKELPKLPQIAEVDLVRHYTNLSKKAYGVDLGFYPLGSCTMKYNPKINEDCAALPGFTNIHPLQPDSATQGCLEVLDNLSKDLCDITGMDDVTLQPAAGAHGEFTGLMLIKAYFESRGEGAKRTKVLVPDSAHGTNPASAAMCGYDIVSVPSDSEGYVDVDALKQLVGADTAALMLTNPSTVGLFDKNISIITKLLHDAGGLVYYDGANLNAIMGVCRPGDMGFDVIHINLHKTMSTPHGGGGPGSGPVGCKSFLAGFLPGQKVICNNGEYSLVDREKSVGDVMSFNGNFLVCLKAYAYILTLGAKGLKQASENAVLNANYLLKLLEGTFTCTFPRPCMHEFVLNLEDFKKKTGVSAADISKNLLDNGIHPPTMYFPLIVPEALMFEPTETESKETLERAASILKDLYRQAFENPEPLHEAPVNMPIRRVDEVLAARNPVLKYEF